MVASTIVRPGPASGALSSLFQLSEPDQVTGSPGNSAPSRWYSAVAVARSPAAGPSSRVRGMMLGLALGDTLGTTRGKLPADGPLRAGVSTQLACFTAEGTIRACVRGNHKGSCHPPSVVRHAYGRWAALQGIEIERMRQRWAHGDDVWPDGWLARVPVLAERRGSAPATVAALAKTEPGSLGRPTTSRGCHALTRPLPVAVVGAAHGSKQSVRLAREIAALTHGDPAAQSAAAHAAVLVTHCLISTLEMQCSRSGERSQVRQAMMDGLDALMPTPA
ncbi:ADP-ribosylglycohydrolase family protein [Streptomyces sp. NPDC058676]|uniref:ADP-ribosylglycohydrolase family protein n=1 Tax=unclassified Streptomyces TaxID=2593676 RepID=UPI00364E987E